MLDVIRERVTVSRVELAGATGLTAATITHAIRELMDVGFVHEVGTARSSGGTPRRLLELEPTACYTVGIQLDRFTATGVVVDLAGHVVARSSMAGAGERDPGEVLDFVADNVNDLLSAGGGVEGEGARRRAGHVRPAESRGRSALDRAADGRVAGVPAG